MGDDTVLRLIEHEWLIDNAIGSVPAATPQLPLIADVQAQRKKLRLAESDEAKTLELDLRKPLDLQRSIHFHRLQLLGITDAETLPARGKGTFKEAWTYRYQPESHITLTERAPYGNTPAAAPGGRDAATSWCGSNALCVRNACNDRADGTKNKGIVHLYNQETLNRHFLKHLLFLPHRLPFLGKYR